MIAGMVAGWMWPTGSASAKSRDSFNISMDSRGAEECNDIRVSAGDLEVVRSENEWTVPGNAAPLRVQSGNNGGILVRGWDGPGYSVRACLGAAADSAAEARSKLQQISVSRSGGSISVSGPDDRYWMAYLLIRAPRGAAMDLESNNAPIGLSNFTGSVEARNQNGPLSLREVDGKVRADVHNGPISVEGGRGDYRLEVQNGPLSVALWGNQWAGNLEGHTQNGPLQLNIPADYRSGVLVDSGGHAPVECRAAQCKAAQRTWERPNRIEFGTGSPVVRLSAENGPVNIE
jgi:hypothetical protein